MNPSTHILLTATVYPTGPMVMQTNPAQRLREYEEVLEFYTHALPHPIVFAENSGFALELA